MANVANGRKAVPARRVKRADELLTRIADWLRDSKASGLPAREAVQYEKVRTAPWTLPRGPAPRPRRGGTGPWYKSVTRPRAPARPTRAAQRVDYFKGTKLVEVLLSERFKSQKGFPTMGSRQDAIGLAGTLMRSQFFHRSQRVFISARRWELEAHPGAFEEVCAHGCRGWGQRGEDTGRPSLSPHRCSGKGQGPAGRPGEARGSRRRALLSPPSGPFPPPPAHGRLHWIHTCPRRAPPRAAAGRRTARTDYTRGSMRVPKRGSTSSPGSSSQGRSWCA